MDYKYMMSERADEIACDEYGMEFYDLSVDIQDKVFARAVDDITDRLAGEADRSREVYEIRKTGVMYERR